MSSVGENLRREREIRGMSLEQVAEATGVSVVYLGAMERGEFEALPGRAFGKLYIRAYAEVLEFDPRPLIENYDREHRPERTEAPELPRAAPAGSRPVAGAIARWKASRAGVDDRLDVENPPEVVGAPPPATEPEAGGAAPETEPVALEPARSDAGTGVRQSRWRTSLLLVGGVVIVAVIYLGTREGRMHEIATAVPAEPSGPSRVPVAPEQPEAPPPSAPAAAQDLPPAAATPAPPGALTVPEFGVGRRIVDRHLEGESDRFSEGDVVVFQTRVLGGKHGGRVRHVWIFDGRAQQSIELRIGGADWRTHTSKTLYRPGPWRVEARDDGGRVLATATFVCAPRNR